jgi:hypothetical protein
MLTKILKFKLLLYCCFWLPYHSFGQSGKSDSTLIPSKWEVGIDLLGLFNENTVPKASIFFRRNYAINQQRCKALRLRIGMDTEVRDAYAHDNVLLGKFNTYSPYLTVGHEWRQLFKRQSWYFATDICGQYLYNDQFFLVLRNDIYDDVKVRNFNVAFNGILGYQINLIKNLSIGVESAFIVRYTEQHSEIIRSDGAAEGGDDWSNFTTSIKPMMTVNLFYSLQNHRKNVKS